MTSQKATKARKGDQKHEKNIRVRQDQQDEQDYLPLSDLSPSRRLAQRAYAPAGRKGQTIIASGE